jgi:hypothetical protein
MMIKIINQIKITKISKNKLRMISYIISWLDRDKEKNHYNRFY